MGKFCPLSIGQRKAADAAKCLGCCAVCCILFSDICGKGSILRAGQNGPAVGIVLFNACANVVQYKSKGIIPGSCSIAVCIAFQIFQAIQKRRIVRHRGNVYIFCICIFCICIFCICIFCICRRISIINIFRIDLIFKSVAINQRCIIIGRDFGISRCFRLSGIISIKLVIRLI